MLWFCRNIFLKKIFLTFYDDFIIKQLCFFKTILWYFVFRNNFLRQSFCDFVEIFFWKEYSWHFMIILLFSKFVFSKQFYINSYSKIFFYDNHVVILSRYLLRKKISKSQDNLEKYRVFSDFIDKRFSIIKTILWYFQLKIIFCDNLVLTLSRYLLRKNIPEISRSLQKLLMRF
jgi:hypothetical protein